MGGCRITPLTVLFAISGCIMLISHRYFLSDTPSRVIVQPRRTSFHSSHGRRAVARPEDEEEEQGAHSLDGSQPVWDSEEEGLAEVIAENESRRKHRTGDSLKADDAEEDEADKEEPVRSYASIVRAAETSLDAYPQPQDEFECKPKATTRPTRKLDYIAAPGSEFPTNCEGREDLCEAVRKTANEHRQLLVAVCNSGIISQLSKWVESNRRANISNMMIVAIDERLPKWLDDNKVAYWKRVTSAAGSHKISAQKFQYVREFLHVGCSVLMSDIDVVYLQDPFLFLHNDADVEGTTDGWDTGSAYGWTEHLDDPSMGLAGRYRPAMRITAWNSGLWYIAATHAGLRLMSILAHRMATEDTWDQAAFGEEVTRPARDAHMAAGITKRALNHWCFCNSKTLFRRIRTEERFGAHTDHPHVPVVVHANYHQPKPPRMSAVYDRWHLGQKDALDRFAGEPTSTQDAPTLEKDFLHMINDGFVSGSNTKDASSAVQDGACRSQPSKHQLQMRLHVRGLTECESGDDLCEAAKAVAKLWTGTSLAADGKTMQTSNDLLLVMADGTHVEELKLLLASVKRASITNLLLLFTDKAAYEALGEQKPMLYSEKNANEESGPMALIQSIETLLVLAGSANAASTPTTGALGFAVARYHVLGRLLALGFGVLSVTPNTVFVSDPFAALYRDADIEAMSTGWDDGSSYGYNHVLDDPSMGFTRFCHGSRIVAYEPGFFYAMPTDEAVALTARMAIQLVRPAAKLGAASSAFDVNAAEREAFLHELWLPSHHEYASVGAVLRVMNYLCFVNSKVLFRQLRNMAGGTPPVAVQINYHADTATRMAATIKRYHDHQSTPLKELPMADRGAAAANDTPLSCERPSDTGDGSTTLGAHLIANSPYAWGGVGDMGFEDGGVLTTPWGKGQWAVHSGDPSGKTVFADFVGAKHNVRFDLATGMGVSSRCNDGNVVLVRSLKAAKEKAK